MFNEEPIVFDCASEQLVGIIHHTDTRSDIGVLIVVGGPQYRVGSHRQFILLARRLAENNIPVMRFDYRGMGDSSGSLRNFEDVSTDIHSAIDVFIKNQQGLERIIIWGLCDAASAALFYAYTDERVIGLVILNPWVRTVEGLNETYIKKYYYNRLFDISLWKSLVTGKLRLSSVASFVADIIKWMKNKIFKMQTVENSKTTLPDRMLFGLKRFKGGLLIILSGDDLTADEFLRVSEKKDWKGAITEKNATTIIINDANHTFSTQIWRDEVERSTIQWVRGLQ